MTKKYTVNWKLRHNGKAYKKGDVVELDLSENTVKSGVVTEVEGASVEGNGEGRNEGGNILDAVGENLQNQEVGKPYIAGLEDKDLLDAILASEPDGKNRKWVLEAVEARIEELTVDA